LLYVLNVKSNDISGFSIDSTGALHYIAGSTQPLSGIAGQDGPVDLRFADSDSVLIAAEKFANILDTFTLTNGRANHAVAHMSAGPTPFGMAVREDGLVVDTEASNDVPHASAVSSYRVSSGGTLTTLTASLHNGQSASCWAAFTPDQRFIYITNTASSTLSEYAVAPSGTLSLIHAIAAAEAPNSAPTDLGVSSDGEFVYVVNQMAHTLRAFSRDADGSLDTLQTVAGLPASAVGIAVH
jgi:6-phosphogluconolactonase (cycloisomerase 2 family)